MPDKSKTAKKRALITAVPLMLVNAVAFSGQFAYINDHVAWLTPGKIAFALALESVALFLAYMAHQALMAEDSAYGLRLSSYAFGAVIGAMNYSHYAGSGMKPTFEAVATGLMSLASPWLWGIYSRRQSRDQLKAKGLIEPRAVKLGTLRWLFYPIKAWKVFRLAVWHRHTEPGEAIAAYEGWGAEAAQEERLAELREMLPDESRKLETALGEPEPNADDRSPIETAQTKADAVRVAVAELGESVKAAFLADWLSQRGWNVTPGYIRTARRRDLERSERVG